MAIKTFGVGENVYCYKAINVSGEEDYTESVYYQVEAQFFWYKRFTIFRDWFTFSIKEINQRNYFYSEN